MAEILFETTKTNDTEQYCVYCHRNKINGKRYIGQSREVDKRWSCNGIHYANCTYFSRAINKYGWDAFDHYIIQDNLTKEQADELEILNIAFYNTTDPKYGYNINAGGSHGGHSCSEETKNKISIANRGKHHTEEAKQKISEAGKGRQLSEETRQKIGNANRGRKHTDAFRQHISEVQTGKTRKPLSESTKQKISKAHKGKTLSVEHRQKLSMAKLGREARNKGKKLMNNGVNNVWVNPEEVNAYLQNGYLLGIIRRQTNV